MIVRMFLYCLQYKLCKVKRVATGPKNVPYLVTHDGRTVRYPDPLIKVNDSIQLDIASSKIMDFIKFESGRYFICQILFEWLRIGMLLFFTAIFSHYAPLLLLNLIFSLTFSYRLIQFTFDNRASAAPSTVPTWHVSIIHTWV